MSSRDRIKMTPEEQQELLEAERVVTIASNGPKGFPHAMPMWYVLRDGEIWIWTYGRSQKVKNLERDPRATLLAETGDAYDELRGVMIEAEAEIVRDTDAVLAVGRELGVRYGGSDGGPGADEVLRKQAAKRVAIHFAPRRTASWDHRKLG